MDNTKKLGDYLTSYTAERIQKMMDIKAGACMVTGCDVEDYLTEYAENLKAMIGIVVRSKVSQSIELSEIGLHLESELLKSLGYDIGREVHRISHALTNDYTGFNSAEYSHHLNCYALEFEKELSRIIDSKLVQLISLSGSKKRGR